MTVITERRGHVFLIGVNRPEKRNPLSATTTKRHVDAVTAQAAHLAGGRSVPVIAAYEGLELQLG